MHGQEDCITQRPRRARRRQEDDTDETEGLKSEQADNAKETKKNSGEGYLYIANGRFNGMGLDGETAVQTGEPAGISSPGEFCTGEGTPKMGGRVVKRRILQNLRFEI